MPQIRKMRITTFLFSGLLAFSPFVTGCTDGRSPAVLSDTGKHAVNWLPADHKTAAASSLDSCRECHGSKLEGGISGVSCTACHLGGPTSVHPSNWVPVYSSHGPYAASNGTSGCSNQYCHGTTLTGVAKSGPSCSSCHLGGPASVHPTDWVPVYSSHGAFAKANTTGACANQYCHGTTLTGVANSGPSCSSCHLGGPTSVHPTDWAPIYTTHGPYVNANTTSVCANQYCHGLSLTGVANSGPSCTSCHMGGITSGHPSDWVPVYSTHGPYAVANGTAACSSQSCHGSSLTGVAGSGPSCTACHLGGPASIHPANWSPVYSTHGPYVAANGTNGCSNQYCHGPSLSGVANSGPSCTSCHMGSATSIHPTEWMGDACSYHGNYAFTKGTAACANIYCHGAGLGGVQDSGPSCTKCHATIPDSDQCSSCHGIPPSGDTYPNKAGKHAQHMQLYGVTCATCHNRSCDQHANGTVNVVFDPAYNAKTGIASFGTATGASCSNVSCHGGPRTQTFAQQQQDPPQSDPAQTPDWYSTSSMNLLDANTCKQCHIYGTAEYNSHSSGKHFEHLGGLGYNLRSCTDCHDPFKLPISHFTDLGTSVISAGAASATMRDDVYYDGANCTNACHTIFSNGTYIPETRNWWE